MPMGSIAKVITAYVVIEPGRLNRLITVPKEIIAYDKKYGASRRTWSCWGGTRCDCQARAAEARTAPRKHVPRG